MSTTSSPEAVFTRSSCCSNGSGVATSSFDCLPACSVAAIRPLMRVLVLWPLCQRLY